MVWFVLGYSGQRTSVKYAEAAWNYKAGGIVHLISPAFFFFNVILHLITMKYAVSHMKMTHVWDCTISVLFMSTLFSFLHQNPQKCAFSGYFYAKNFTFNKRASLLKMLNPGVFIREYTLSIQNLKHVDADFSYGIENSFF